MLEKQNIIAMTLLLHNLYSFVMWFTNNICKLFCKNSKHSFFLSELMLQTLFFSL